MELLLEALWFQCKWERCGGIGNGDTLGALLVRLMWWHFYWRY